MENSEYDDEDERPENGFQVEQLKSYAVYARRAIVSRWRLSAALLGGALALTFLVNKYVPRTYTCTTVIMAVGSPVLDSGTSSNSSPLTGASGLVLRHDNLETMIRDVGLIAKAEQRRPPLLKLKDWLSNSISGPQTEQAKIGALIGTLENKIQISSEGQTLTISADWTDGQTAADLTDAARESFLKARHAVEVSAFEEKMNILDQHATKLRDEIEQLAQQINTQSERATVATTPTPAPAPAVGTTPPRPSVQVRLPTASRPAEPDAELPTLKEKLETDKKKLAELDAEHERSVRDEQAKLADLKLRLTPAHPLVVTQEERVAMVSQVPAEMNALQAEVKDLAAQIKSREAAAHLSGEAGGVRIVNSAPGGAEPLPAVVVQALQKDDTDRALAEQLTGAVGRYGILRNDIGSGRLDLDTAQAAFSHRYQIIVPVEVPTKAKKPKAIVILGGGFVMSFLLALLLPILAELRRGVILDRWQVHQLQLPILAELNLPPKSE